MKIYIDSDFKCHVEAAEDSREVETSFFEDKCPALIEAYRFIPLGEKWTREDGVVFCGEMISPWNDLTGPLAAQAEYERKLIENMRQALEIMEVTV